MVDNDGVYIMYKQWKIMNLDHVFMMKRFESCLESVSLHPRVDKGSMRCFHCKRMFPSDEEITQHMIETHSRNVCEKCHFYHRNRLIVRRHQRFCFPVHDFDENAQWV